mmetsp:Transcript_9406/g.28087  ORF Transcript_9406/g.28087 Transcript_9406/m.28087 type:complete len:160 (-) Transcript_9406:1141-1620(-)
MSYFGTDHPPKNFDNHFNAFAENSVRSKEIEIQQPIDLRCVVMPARDAPHSKLQASSIDLFIDGRNMNLPLSMSSTQASSTLDSFDFSSSRNGLFRHKRCRRRGTLALLSKVAPSTGLRTVLTPVPPHTIPSRMLLLFHQTLFSFLCRQSSIRGPSIST